MSLADDLKKQTDDFRTKKIDYQVDTLGVDNKSSSLGYYRPGANTITMNYYRLFLLKTRLDGCIICNHKSTAFFS